MIDIVFVAHVALGAEVVVVADGALPTDPEQVLLLAVATVDAGMADPDRAVVEHAEIVARIVAGPRITSQSNNV